MWNYILNGRRYNDYVNGTKEGLFTKSGHPLDKETFEQFTKVSETIPGQTLSLKELLSRYVMGSPVKQFKPVYTNNTDIPDNLERMEFDERLEHAKVIRHAIHREQQKQQYKKQASAETDSSSEQAEGKSVASPSEQKTA